MSSWVLDASALLALLNRELGSEKVVAALPDAVMSSVNLSEVVAKLVDHVWRSGLLGIGRISGYSGFDER